MPIVSRHLHASLVVVIAAMLATTPAPVSGAGPTRQVSVESLVYDLKNPDAVRRQTAARELGAAKYRPSTPNLVAMANDPVDAVRREVELALERMDDIQALPGFIAFASDAETDIRSRAVESLVNLYVPHAFGVGATLTNLRDRIMFASDRDLEVMVEPDVAIDATVVATLRERIADSDRGIRRSAIRGLGILRARPAVPDLLQIVREDRDDGLRFEGVRALRKIGDASIAGDLLGLLNINADSVRNELIATLGAMRHRDAVPELTRIVEQAKPTDQARVLARSASADSASTRA